MGTASVDRSTLELLLGMTWAEILGALFRFEARPLPAPIGSKNEKVAERQAKAVNRAMTTPKLQGVAAALNALTKTY